MQNTEIERRFLVKDREEVLQKLATQGTKLYENHQIDTYFTPQHRNFVAERYPYEWLRLRDDAGKYSLTYKHWYPEGVLESTHCTELETGVTNLDNFEKILTALDFQKVVVVDKTRLAFQIGNMEIVVDSIKDLGDFIEIEIKDGYEGVEDATAQILALAKKLDLEEVPADKDIRAGYAFAVYKKQQSMQTK